MELKTDSKGFTKGIAGAEKGAKRLQGRFGGVTAGLSKLGAGLKTGGVAFAALGAAAAVAAGAVFLLTKRFAEQGDKLAKTSKSIGVGVEQLQKWQFAVDRSGGDSEKFVKGLVKMRVELERVALGETAESASAFERLGINIKNLTTGSILPLEELLPQIADKISNLTNEQEKASVAALIFGTRLGAQLVPFLNEGAEGIERLGEQAAKYGLISADAAKKSEDFMDALRNLTQAFTGAKSVIAEQLLPAFTNAIQRLTDWIAKNKELIAQDVKGFIDEVKIAVENMKVAFGGVPNSLDNTKREFTLLTDTMKGVNEALITFLEGLAILKTVRIGFTALEFLDPARAGTKGIGGITAELKEQDAAITELNRRISVMRANLAGLGKEESKAARSTGSFALGIREFAESLIDAEKGTDKLIGDDEGDDGGGVKGLTAAVDEQIKINEDALNSIEELTKQWQEEADTLGFTSLELRQYTLDTLAATVANEEMAVALKEAQKALDALNLKETIAASGEAFQSLEEEFGLLPDQVEELGEAFSSLDVFIGNVASNIASTFSDLIFNTLTGQFNSLKDIFKNALRSMLKVFTDFIGTILANPIRISLEGVLGGGGGGGVNLANIGSSVAGLLGGIGTSFGALGTLGGAALGIESSLGTLAIAGLGTTLLAALPAIGLVVGALAIGIPLIMDALESKPRLDIDIGILDRDIEKRAAIVAEFLDPALLDEIVQISVKRKSGLGVGGDEGIRKLISDVIQGTIEAIQAILAQLPTDLFEQLNEMLLNAEIDIESKIKGDKLLEFDESGKNIAKKFQQFLEELPGRFSAAILDDFFTPALEALGVTAEAAEKITSDFLASLQGMTREQRIEAGKEFLLLFDAYVDVFNLLNGTIQGVFEKAIADIKRVSSELDIASVSGIPSLEQIQLALEDLFETGLLTAETAQKFLELRAAIISLTLGLAQSISNITSIISQLDTDIVALGGTAIGSTDAIKEAINALQGLLDNEALSLDEQEAILKELNSLTDQLAASELAKAQAGIQAQIDSTNNQIQNLQKLKTAESKKNKEALDALNKELKLVQDLESLIDSIRQNIQSFLLAPGGPESVFERIGRAQAEIGKLFGELATAGPEEQAKIAAQIQDLLNELDQLRQEAFQAPSPESDALFREIIGGLEMLEGLIEPARSSEEIQESIEAIEKESQAFLDSIDSQIESMNASLSSLQSAGNQLTGQVADEILALKEAIRAQFIEILEQRLEQLGEVTEVGLAEVVIIEEEQLTVLKEIAEGINILALGTGESGFSSVPAILPSFQHGGFVPPGRNMIAQLHGGSFGEDIIPRGQSNRDGDINVALNLPPITFERGQVVSPQMFTQKLLTMLHDRRITDEIAKAVRSKR